MSERDQMVDQSLKKIMNFDLNQLILYLDDINFLDLLLQYRGEGNENIVFSLLNIKYVLRFHKSAAAVDVETENENLRISFLYHYFIVRGIFGDGFSVVPILVEIPKEKIKWFNTFFQKERPDDRQGKHLFYNVAEVYPDLTFLPLYRKFFKTENAFFPSVLPEIDFSKQTLAVDYMKHRNFVFSLLTNATFRQNITTKINGSSFDTLCVEIKPKQGWTAEADRLLGICPFCLNQYQKLSTRKVDFKSGYCPLDLFSGDSERMLRSLKELIKCPQNNFRLFKNGNLVYSESNLNDLDKVLGTWFNDDDIERSVNNFCYLITKILTHEIVNDDEQLRLTCDGMTKTDKNWSFNSNVELIEQIITMLETRCRQESSSLPENSILGRILLLQKLDSAGLEAARHYYVDHATEYDSDYSYVHSLISRTESEKPMKKTNLNILEAYLLSTAAKDLSILMSFKRIDKEEESSEFIVLDQMERRYEVNVSVVDVGPKPVSCLEKHVKRNESMLKTFIAHHYASLSKKNKSS